METLRQYAAIVSSGTDIGLLRKPPRPHCHPQLTLTNKQVIQTYRGGGGGFCTGNFSHDKIWRRVYFA